MRQSFCHITSMVGQQGIIEAAGIYLEIIVRGGEEYLNALPVTSNCTHG